MEDFELNQDLKFSSTHSSWHLVIVPFNYWSFTMVFEHLHDCFHLKDFVNGFFQLFQFCFHIPQGHIYQYIAHVLKITHLLAIAKSFGGVNPIVVREIS
jgi:hypothetical protein